MQDRIEKYCRSIIDELSFVEIAGESMMHRASGYVQRIATEVAPRSPNNAPLRLPENEICSRFLYRGSAPEAVIIVAEPGSGKSELLRQLAWRLARYNRDLDAHNAWRLPIRLHFRKPNTDLLPPYDPEQPWLSVLRATRGMLDEDDLTSLRTTGSLVLIIDGFDELPSEDARARLVRSLRRELATGGVLFDCSLVVASRPFAADALEFRPSHRVLRCSLERFSESDIEAYVRRFFQDHRSKQEWFLDQIRHASPKLLKMMENPLMLGLFSRHVLKQSGELRRPDAHQLMTEWLLGLLRRRAHLIAHLDSHIRVLQLLALEYFLNDARPIDPQRAIDLVNVMSKSDDQVRAAYSAGTGASLRRLANHSAIMTSEDGGGSFTFFSGMQPLVEFLGGCQLARSASDAELLSFFGKHAFQPKWEEVFGWMISQLWHLRERRPIAIALIEWLLAHVLDGSDDAVGTLIMLTAKLLGNTPAEYEGEISQKAEEYVRLVLESPATATRWRKEWDWHDRWLLLPETARRVLAHAVALNIEPQDDSSFPEHEIKYLGRLGISDTIVQDALCKPDREIKQIPYFLEIIDTSWRLGIHNVDWEEGLFQILHERSWSKYWRRAAEVIRNCAFSSDAASAILQSAIADRSAWRCWGEAAHTLRALSVGTREAHDSLLRFLREIVDRLVERHGEQAFIVEAEEILKAVVKAITNLGYVSNETEDVLLVIGSIRTLRCVWKNIADAIRVLKLSSHGALDTLVMVLQDQEATEAWSNASQAILEFGTPSVRLEHALTQVFAHNDALDAWTWAALALRRLGPPPSEITHTMAQIARDEFSPIDRRAVAAKVLHYFRMHKDIVNEVAYVALKTPDATVAWTEIHSLFMGFNGDQSAVAERLAEIAESTSDKVQKMWAVWSLKYLGIPVHLAHGIAERLFSQLGHWSGQLLAEAITSSKSKIGIELAIKYGHSGVAREACRESRFTITAKNEVCDRKTLFLLPQLLPEVTGGLRRDVADLMGVKSESSLTADEVTNPQTTAPSPIAPIKQPESLNVKPPPTLQDSMNTAATDEWLLTIEEAAVHLWNANAGTINKWLKYGLKCGCKLNGIQDEHTGLWKINFAEIKRFKSSHEEHYRRRVKEDEEDHAKIGVAKPPQRADKKDRPQELHVCQNCDHEFMGIPPSPKCPKCGRHATTRK